MSRDTTRRSAGRQSRLICRRDSHTANPPKVTAPIDGVNHAKRATAPALYSVALMDPVCPPSTVYAAYHHYAARKQMQVWPYNGHEGGQTYQQAEHLRFLRDAFG